MTTIEPKKKAPELDPKDPAAQQKDEKIIMPADYYYPENYVETTLQDSSISKLCFEFHECFGIDSFKRYNMNLLDDETLIFIAGVTYQIFNFVTNQREIYFSKDGGGIGSVAVHPSKKFFAVAEKGVSPNVYIYQYPSLKLYRILRKGTEKSYSNITFSSNGIYLASVGSGPDFLLCVWDWIQENIILKSKAFSQEIYRVTFSEYQDDVLTTSGMGHIKFWKIAETFTGLKLKGEIGKFGQNEISDITAYYEFPDGKVLSGTEYGKLLLWEGNLIKCVIGINENTPCHKGAIEVVFRDDKYILSAGEDGYIRFWDFETLDNAESDDLFNFFISPTREQFIQHDENASPAHIIWITKSINKSFWILCDARGKIFKVNLEDFALQMIYQTNSGKFNGIVTSETMNAAISIGDDSAVRLWDFVNKKEFYSRSFYSKATCIDWLAYSNKNKGRIIGVGFGNGIVRFLLLKEKEFYLLKALKVHPNGITHLKFTADGRKVVVISEVGDIFFLEIDQNNLHNYEPFCLYETKYKINSVTWNKFDDKILLACKDGCIYEIKVPKKEQCDLSQTYLKTFNAIKYSIKMMESQKPKRDEMDLEFLLKRKNQEDRKEDNEWESAQILCATYHDTDNKYVLAAVDGKFLGNLYLIDFNQERPIKIFRIPKGVPIRYMEYKDHYELLLLGYNDGSFEVRSKTDLEVSIKINCHDRDYGRTRGVAFNKDKTAILSTSDDGTIFCYKCDMDSFRNSLKGGFVNPNYPVLMPGLTDSLFKEEIEVRSEESEDILNEKIYSIQQAKLLAEEDHKKSLAEQKKTKVLEIIRNLRESFEDLKNKNLERDEYTKLKPEEICVDPEYNEMLKKRIEEELEETRKELAWDIENSNVLTRKLKNYVRDELIYDKFAVCGLSNSNIYVKTFKLKKLSEYVWSNLEEIHKLIDEENRAQKDKTDEPQSILKKTTINLTSVSPLKKPMDLKITTTGVAVKEQKSEPAKNQETKPKEEEEEKEPVKKGAKYEREKNKKEEEELRRLMEELKKTKPSQDSLDPDHLREINDAIEKLGDYKLKSASDYIVPEDKRMNVSKKRKHMFLLEEFIYDTKLKLNHKIKDLRERKKNLMEKIEDYNQKISVINKQLGVEENLFHPNLDLEKEMPEDFLNVNEQDIDEYGKLKDKGSKKPGMYGSGGENIEEEKKHESKPQEGQSTKKPEPSTQYGSSPGVKQRKGMKVQMTQLETETKTAQEMILNAEKKRLKEEIQEDIEAFDRDLMNCQLDRNMIESEMKIAEMKLITYYQELLILNDMEARDKELIEELFKFRKEKDNFEEQRTQIEIQLSQIRESEAETDKKLTDFMKQFKEAVFPEDENKRNKIHEYYRKKHKKTKTNKFLKRNEDEEEGEEQVEGEESDEDFMDDDEEEKPDIQPIENDTRNKEIIQTIVELEDEQEKNKKTRQDLDRQKSNIVSKKDVAAGNLKTTEGKIRDYQREKLQKINKLDISTFLKLSQIQNLIQIGSNWVCPEDLSNSILFTSDELNKLVKRNKELKLEEGKNQKQKAILDRKVAQYKKEADEKDAKIKELNAKHNEKHLLKFGEVIDLKQIDALEPTKQVLEMREKFKLEEKDSIKKVESSKTSLTETKKKLFEAKKENTKIISRITNFGELQMKLNKKLDSTNKQLFKEENDDKRNDLDHEKENLDELKNFLSKEIEDLKTEISLFKRKGGHIYTMVTSNKKPLGGN